MTLRAVSSFSATGSSSRKRHRAILVGGALIVSVALANCGSDSTKPVDPITKVPDFIYVSNASGAAQLYVWHQGTTTLFPGTVAGDNEPQSAGGKVVFTSYRIAASNPEIFIANLDGSNSVRLTTQSGTDHEPSLSPDGGTVVFTSTRSGASRIYTMSADGSNPTPLNTGSDSDTPESSPRFSPGGGRILFSSPRTNTTQIWIMPSAGGTATQITHEVNGAFFGSWSPDGDFIYYVDGGDRTKIHKVEVSSGTVTDYVTGGTDVGDAACNNVVCLVVSNVTGLNPDIYAYIGAGDASPLAILITANAEFQPAILH